MLTLILTARFLHLATIVFYVDYRYLHPEGTSSGQLQPPANPAVFYSGSSSNSKQFHTPSPNRLQSEPLSTFGYPAGEMMNNILLQSISSTLENIQMQLKAIEDKHQQTDDAVADLKILLQDIKSVGKKQASSSRKSPPGLSVSIAEITYFGNEQQIKLICDWACKNRAYPHIKIGMFFELLLPYLLN